jgi:hypothetical protein
LADLPFKEEPLAAPVSQWTGWYVGANIGYGFANSTDPVLSVVNPGNQGNLGGFLTGIQHGNEFPNLKPQGDDLEGGSHVRQPR